MKFRARCTKLDDKSKLICSKIHSWWSRVACPNLKTQVESSHQDFHTQNVLQFTRQSIGFSSLLSVTPRFVQFLFSHHFLNLNWPYDVHKGIYLIQVTGCKFFCCEYFFPITFPFIMDKGVWLSPSACFRYMGNPFPIDVVLPCGIHSDWQKYLACQRNSGLATGVHETRYNSLSLLIHR